MASNAKKIGSADPTRPRTAVEERKPLQPSTREQEIKTRAHEIYLQRGAQPGYEVQGEPHGGQGPEQSQEGKGASHVQSRTPAIWD
jgi:hypothetical protein